MRDTGPDEGTKQIVYVRARHRCERCGGGSIFNIHHRLPRRMGGTRWPLVNHPVNLVLLCTRCHEWVESHREQSVDEGWLLRSQWISTTDAADIPLPPRRGVVGVREAKPDVSHHLRDTGRVEPALGREDTDSTSVLPFQELTNN